MKRTTLTARLGTFRSAMARGPQPHEWLLLLVMLGLAFRYFSLVDDSFIYFRYADNALFLGRGLVYNAGERVEGFTSPLWMLLLVLIRATGLDFWTMVRGLSLVCGTTLWGALVALNRALTSGRRSINLPLAFAAGHYGVLSSLSSGLETPLVMLAACACAGMAVLPGSTVLAILAGLTPLVRHELALPWALMVAWIGIRGRRVPFWHVLGGVLPLFAWLAFRVRYYADLLPNTFYLKDEIDWGRGLDYLRNVLAPHGLQWFLPALLAGGWIAARHPAAQGSRLGALEARLLLLAAGIASGIYAVRVGGDMLYFRLLAFPICLLVLASAGVIEQLGALVGLERRAAWLFPLLALVVAGLSLAAYPPQLRQHPLVGDAMRKWRGISDLAWHRSHESLRWTPQRAAEDRAQRLRYAAADAKGRTQEQVLAIGWCRAAFDRFDAYVEHHWGLTEPVLARMNVRSQRAGHKPALRPRADEIASLRRVDSAHLSPGFFRRAVQSGTAPAWVAPNLLALEILERKASPDRSTSESLALALRRVPPIQIAVQGAGAAGEGPDPGP